MRPHLFSKLHRCWDVSMFRQPHTTVEWATFSWADFLMHINACDFLYGSSIIHALILRLKLTFTADTLPFNLLTSVSVQTHCVGIQSQTWCHCPIIYEPVCLWFLPRSLWPSLEIIRALFQPHCDFNLTLITHTLKHTQTLNSSPLPIQPCPFLKGNQVWGIKERRARGIQRIRTTAWNI